jgi:xanthine dehydrogenase accessory factor
MQDVAEGILSWQEAGTPALFARVLSLQGFSTWTGDELVAFSGTGDQRGEVLGRYGAEQLTKAGNSLLSGEQALGRLVVEVHGDRVAEAGLACGGQAEFLLQPVSALPVELWRAIARRAPVALVTQIDGSGTGPLGVAVYPDGRWVGAVGSGNGARPPDEALAAAGDLLGAGRTGHHLLEHPLGMFLVEAWVPEPRLVVVGGGDLVVAITAQAALLGWETRASEALEALGGLLDWGGASSALIVLTHDGEVDAPALAEGLARGIAYVGAMGSRRTQSRRVERLEARGVSAADISRIRRPIGLDLGGRRPSEVALAIAAEILAVRSGRDGRPLQQRAGPIHQRPAVTVPT